MTITLKIKLNKQVHGQVAATTCFSQIITDYRLSQSEVFPLVKCIQRYM